LQSDFRVAYVAHYTERALPMGYKIAAFWAGQEGSLLLWAWVLAIMCSIALFQNRCSQGLAPAATAATLAAICGFFVALMMFAANPFTALTRPPLDGHGLNPMLQDPGMIAHPPLLFLGYAGFAIPFAFLIGSLATDSRDNHWVTQIRRWSLLSWLFLSVGILLGAQWAYVELGWGGYWAWDPVENASLLPWLTATAFLHTLASEQRRGMFKIWNASLVAITFILCILGTYITRSGVVQSVHSFGESLVGTFFLVFLILITAVSAGLILWRLKSLKSEHELSGLFTREGAFMMGNVLLLSMMLVTLYGTIFPLLSGIFGQPRTPEQSWYNAKVVPLALVLTAIMAVGPLLTHGADAARRLGRGMIAPGLVAILAIGLAWFRGIQSGWALVCIAITGVAMLNMANDLTRSVVEHVRTTGENPAAALLRLIDHNHRRYGGQITHLGMIFIVIGVAGTSLFSLKPEPFQLNPGTSEQIGGYSVKLDSLKEVRESNFTAVEATLSITRPDGSVVTLKPQRRFYDKNQDANTEVAIESSWREDLYLTLAGWEESGKVVAIQAIVNPLMSWIWIGGLTLSLGAILCMLPRFCGVTQEIPAAEHTQGAERTHKLQPTAEVTP
jgi:cytochrome c-type biogenesis protein CcmF